ncbi:MAG: hypothetical protein IJY22_00385 [Clostridia bacterium]|nr:hypothetical protein [Clostridia bacterium]
MEIDQAKQLAMLLTAFLCGVAMALLWELLAALRILLGAHRPPARMRGLYEKKLPLLLRGVPFDRPPLGKFWRSTVIALLDCLFCLLFALAVILILYDYCNGALRLSVPVLALVGYGLCHMAAVTLLAPLTSLAAYGLGAAWLYLCALLRLVCKGIKGFFRLLLCPIFKLNRSIALRRARARSAALGAAQLQFAQKGLEGNLSDLQKKGSTNHVQKNRRKNHRAAVGDPHSDPDHSGGSRHHCRAQHHGGQSKSPRCRG